MSQLVLLKITINQIIPHVKNIMTTNIYIAFTTTLTFIICNVMSCGNNYIIIEVTWLSLSINPFMLRPNHHQKEGQSHTHHSLGWWKTVIANFHMQHRVLHVVLIAAWCPNFVTNVPLWLTNIHFYIWIHFFIFQIHSHLTTFKL